MGKKRRDGRASKRGNSASSSNAGARNSRGGGSATASIRCTGGIYEGELKGGKPHGKGRMKFDNGDVYDGEWKEGTPQGSGSVAYANGNAFWGELKDGKPHGKGTMKFEDGEVQDGKVYDGEWKDGKRHGSGKCTYECGNVYDGQWVEGDRHGRGSVRGKDGDVLYEGELKDGKPHGRGDYKWVDGRAYEGELASGRIHGWGAMTWPSGQMYEGEWADDETNGNGTMKYSSGEIYRGKFADGKRSGWGTMEYTSGNVYRGEWVDGKKHGKGGMKLRTGGIYAESWEHGELVDRVAAERFPSDGSATGDSSSFPNRDTRSDDATPTANCQLLDGRKLRSGRSQQRRLETVKQTCEHCGVDDYHYKLRACSGCNLALYCSEACQKAASRSHRRICDISSQLPLRDADRLVLHFDSEKMVDFDAGLRYGTKYMDNLKILAINIDEMDKDGAVKLSAKRLSSLFKSKQWALESVFLQRNGCTSVPGVSENSYEVWKELHGLKQLRLHSMKFDTVQNICDIIGQQRNTLMVLCLPWLQIHWHKAKCRRTMVQAVKSCKHLVKLDLQGGVLMDSDLKVMLGDLPNLRILHLLRDSGSSHEFTDNTCGLIARKCPGLQELSLFQHDELSVRGIRKIFEGCPHLLAFYTTTLKLSSKDVQSLLNVAPQLMYLSLSQSCLSKVELEEIIEATGGRVVLQLNSASVFEPESVSVKTGKRYESQRDLLRNKIWSRVLDPEVTNHWAGLSEG